MAPDLVCTPDRAGQKIAKIAVSTTSSSSPPTHRSGTKSPPSYPSTGARRVWNSWARAGWAVRCTQSTSTCVLTNSLTQPLTAAKNSSSRTTRPTRTAWIGPCAKKATTPYAQKSSAIVPRTPRSSAVRDKSPSYANNWRTTGTPSLSPHAASPVPTATAASAAISPIPSPPQHPLCTRGR